MSDYYNILGVDKKSTQDEIKKAFRKKAVAHHPDKGGNEATFKKINEAYNTLSDNNKRQMYDMQQSGGGIHMGPFGGPTGGPFGGPGGPFGGPGGGPFGGPTSGPFGGPGGGPFGHMGPDFMNMFFRQTQQQTNQSHPFMNRQSNRQKESAPTELRQTIQVNMEDVYKGMTKTLNVKTSKKCIFCLKPCQECKGSGMIEKSVTKTMHHAKFVQISKVKCETCSGSGDISNKTNCDKCNKTGVFEKNTTIKIELPPKSYHDFVSRIKHPEEDNVFIVIKVIVKCPDKFYKNGDNLCYTHKLHLIDTLLGTNIKIHLPTGEDIEIDYTKRTDIIRPDTVLYIDNKGVIPGSDLMVKFDIEYPKTRLVHSESTEDTFSSLRENLEKVFNNK